ncbi:actin-depolymerizing factor 6 [Achlya hypogyna]|uniref:Actin-depolymerizing factor 6 n=1 Tax=Achlya hypogyna TaxID=1202772 RepID=A0A1V9YKX4_ACHHY|nr:actin-depolymerizing factor 6 [Achlya hypogyna]
MSARENHLKTAGVPQFIHAEGAATGPISPSPAALEAFRAVKMKRQFRFVFFRIEGASIEVERSGPPSATAADLAATLPHADCRYVIYDHEVTTHDGRKTSKLFFILWAPPTANPQAKMAYSYAKGNFRGQCDGCFDLNAGSTREFEQGVGLASADDEDSESDFE